ncbi:hypothetical protein K4F52_009409 [Lecanicillium sp. MT-2017a]|nr:hypothetical protein K4F52_009409 [Lecanicillium sp. MT-2017a]
MSSPIVNGPVHKAMTFPESEDFYNLSAEAKIRYDLNHGGPPRWGWVIYRTCYQPELDAAWEAFKQYFERELRTEIVESDAPEIADKADWAIIEDPELDGASMEQLKSRFRDWARADSNGGVDKSSYSRGPRYEVFVQVDEAALRSFLGHRVRPNSPATGLSVKKGHVNLVLGWKESVQPGGEVDENGDVDNEDWMMIPTTMLRSDFYLEIGDEEQWFHFYSPPSDGVITEW